MICGNHCLTVMMQNNFLQVGVSPLRCDAAVVVHVIVRIACVAEVYVKLLFGNAEVEGQLSNVLRSHRRFLTCAAVTSLSSGVTERIVTEQLSRIGVSLPLSFLFILLSRTVSACLDEIQLEH
jgi:hypothetical protein